MEALKEEKIRIPDDISLITFDDHPYLAWTSPPAGGNPDEIVPHQITIPVETTG